MPQARQNWLVYGDMAFDPSRNTWIDLSRGATYPVYGGSDYGQGMSPTQRIQAAAKAAGIEQTPTEATASTQSGDPNAKLPDPQSNEWDNSLGIPEGGTTETQQNQGDITSYAQSLSDYWDAVDQYGAGNFGYDAQGNIVPFLDQGGNQQPSLEVTGASQNPNQTPSLEVTGDSPNPTQTPSLEVSGDSPNPISNQTPSLEASGGVNSSYGQALQDYYSAVDQYGYGGFSYDANGNIVPNPQQSGQPSSQPVQQPAGAQPQNAPPPEELPTGMSPGSETGVFAASGPFSTRGVGPQFSGGGVFDSSSFNPAVGTSMHPSSSESSVGAVYPVGGGPISDSNDPTRNQDVYAPAAITPNAPQQFATGWEWVHMGTTSSSAPMPGAPRGYWRPTGFTSDASKGFLMPLGGKDSTPLPVQANPASNVPAHV